MTAEKNYVWKRLWARKFAPFIASAFMEVLRKRPGLNLSRNKLFVPEGNLHAIYFEARELDPMIANYTKLLQRQPMNQYARWYERQFKNFLDWSKRMTKHNFSKFTNRKLAMTVERLFAAMIDFSELQFYAFLVLEGAAKTVGERFQDQPEIVQAIVTPYKRTKIAKSRIALLRLVREGKTDEKHLAKYTRTFAWLPVYDFTDTPLTLHDVHSEAAHIRDAAKELDGLIFHERRNLAEYRNFFTAIKDKELKKLVEIVHHFSYLKEMRDDYRRPAYFLWLPFWDEVGRRLNATRAEANFLTAPELAAALNSGADVRNLVSRRTLRYAHWLREGTLTVYAGDETQQVEKFVAPSSVPAEIAGFSASPGKVVGRVSVVYHRGEFAKFKDGDILVTTMTHPEFLLIMKKSSAVVTDEGGITCHAAIVAREMQKPCIIGTKIATKVLKDGDVVEVDAERGIVTILKQNK